jgi:hypothetical protein
MDYSTATGYAGAQATVGGLNVPRTMPRLEQLSERSSKSLAELHELNCRLDSLANRLIGSAPEPVRDMKDQPPASSIVAQLERGADGLQGLLGRLRSIADRLDTL